MIVELVGPPGAGKTTLLPAVQAFFREEGQTAFTVVEAARPFVTRTLAGRLLQRLAPSSLQGPLLWRLFLLLSFVYRLRFLGQHAPLVWDILRGQRRRPRAADAAKRKVTFWIFRLMGYYEFLKAKLGAEEVLLLDEGFLHRAVQLFSSAVEEPDSSRIDGYTQSIPRPDLVIFVCASPATCYKRIYKRGLWTAFRHKDAAEVESFVNNAHCAVTLAVASTRRLGWTVIQVNNDQNDPLPAQEALRQQLDAVTIRKMAVASGDFV